MTAPRFVDTNILIYAHDRDAGDKRSRAKALLVELWEQGVGCLSVQVLQEFFVNVTRKIPQPLPTAEAREVIRAYLPGVRVETDGARAIRATEIADAWHTSFWDGMILAAAEKAGATELFSEDLQHGQRIAGVTIVNPFLP
ncbi:MAG: PIN domain-containing protein [Betaproteobacteria bacterium]|nr:PIN domain-containing protein [Betaproteobacteria bacterium]